MVYDVLVIGTGIAGLRAALEAKKAGVSVAVLSKSNPFRSNSAVASGGINAALGNVEEDSIEKHFADTFKGGSNFNDKKALALLCSQGPQAIEELDVLGVPFDKTEEGKIAQRAFGGAGSKRTCHIADKTGSAIVQKLLVECRHLGVEILPNMQFLNIITEKKRVAGITALKRNDSTVVAFACKSLILAAGGYAGIFRGHSTNPQEACGDTLAAALRAGLTLRDMEFVQFHPTTLAKNGTLITEAARGEGGYLINTQGERFVDELTTRDKLSRAIVQEIKKSGRVYLDLRHLDEALIDAKLPSVKKSALLGGGIDVTKELIPIEPAAHYTGGGISCKADTATAIKGLFVCGENAGNGVHGANRLGGNSLLEGVVFGKIAGKKGAAFALRHEFLPVDYRYVDKEMRAVRYILEGENRFNVNAMRKSLGEVLFKEAGIFKSSASLMKALDYVHYLYNQSVGLHCINKEANLNVELSSILEFKNSLLVAEAMILSAQKRKESRGVHYRTDYPEQNDACCNDHLEVSLWGSHYLKVYFSHSVLPMWKSLYKKLNRTFS